MDTLIFSQNAYTFIKHATIIEVIDNQDDYVAAWISLKNVKVLIEYLQANSHIYEYKDSYSENEIFIDGYSYTNRPKIIEIYDSEEHHAYWISKEDIDNIVKYIIKFLK